ncbi:nucleotidyl transferase AbiEii/AbiGii toxin family protein [bacterium]|nr:nucleotidyl transferase AbiEii/AbiGii toxin family protein [bacterium]
MDEPADKVGALRDAVRALDQVAAACALIGGVAVGIRSGLPRATLDTDLAVVSTADRAATVRALVAAGFEPRGEFAHSVNFRHASGEPLQIVFDPSFDPMIERSEVIPVGGVPVRVVTTADLITMKERAAADPGRRRSKALRDAADVALLRGDVPDPDEGW